MACLNWQAFFYLNCFAKWGEVMRTNANQQQFPLDAPDSQVTFCKTQARAVQICLRIAFKQFGRSQLQVAQLCGWKTDSCLSEIARESHSRNMPKTKRDRFALATGCNLLLQVIDRLEANRKAAGKATERDFVDSAVDACMAHWNVAPMTLTHPQTDRRQAA